MKSFREFLTEGALSTKVKNEISKLLPDCTFTLKNINVNGNKRGCSGFIKYNPSGKIVYINTENNTTVGNKVMYRVAKSEKDYTGMQNRWCEEKDLATRVVELLKSEDYK